MTPDVIALSIYFFKHVKRFEVDGRGKIKAPGAYKKKVMIDIAELLAGSLTHEIGLAVIDNFVASNPEKMTETYSLSEVMDKMGYAYRKGVPTVNPDNLIVPGKFYYHPELQLTPPPPVITQLPNGDFHSAYEPFYLEIKEEFTLEDVVHYFYRKVGVLDASTIDKDKGAFKHMLKSYDVDFLLHLIDEYYAQSVDRGEELSREPFSIQSYVQEAHEVYGQRKNTCFEGGFDRVIPRTR